MVRSRCCDIAWRTIDAQFFGVAQRRKRVFLVADYRKTGRATEILFESEGMRKPLETSRSPWVGNADNASPITDESIFSLAGNTIGRSPKNGGNGNGWNENVSYTLTAMDRHAVFIPDADSGVVRRLTPIECERLQGLPDNYTKVDETSSDSARYKALGNGMAIPCSDFILATVVQMKNGRYKKI